MRFKVNHNTHLNTRRIDGAWRLSKKNGHPRSGFSPLHDIVGPAGAALSRKTQNIGILDLRRHEVILGALRFNHHILKLRRVVVSRAVRACDRCPCSVVGKRVRPGDGVLLRDEDDLPRRSGSPPKVIRISRLPVHVGRRRSVEPNATRDGELVGFASERLLVE